VEVERCIDCDNPTGRSGEAEDSIYTPGKRGPFCIKCFEDGGAVDLRATQIVSLKATIAELKRWQQQMVDKAADESLDGYRELGMRCAAAETMMDDLREACAGWRQRVGQWESVFGHLSKDPDKAGNVIIGGLDASYDLKVAAVNAADAIERREFGGTSGYPYAEAIRTALSALSDVLESKAASIDADKEKTT
jgi:hypothetical protein